ncbi:MAG: Do family serine endopeptidase [Neisseriales bacterium]|nr:MAG: Do family serine endopeptidase [Neisseriales bacterium]
MLKRLITKKKLITILILSITACSNHPETQAQNNNNNTEHATLAKQQETTIDQNNPSSMANCTLGGPNFVNLVKQVGDSVVNISAEINPTQRNANLGIDPNDPLAQLYRYFGVQPQQQKPSRASGSGFIVSNDGYVLTNAHVVNKATKISVTTHNKQAFNAKLVGLDTKTDIALLKIESGGLIAAKIGNPESLEVGEWVVAIGAPFGLDNTVTAGIVSAKGRNLPSENYVPFIQTDVAINPGNSGGPLFNTKGEVVGINSQIYSRSGGFMGISFSIPIDIAMKIADQLKVNGKVYHGQLGINIQEVTPELAASFGLSKPSGALVANVSADSGAAKAGIQAGDIILKAEGKEIIKASDLPIIIGSKKPGDIIDLSVLRNGSISNLKVTLGKGNEPEDEQPLLNVDKTPKLDKQHTENIEKFGLQVLNVNDPRITGKVRAKYGVVVLDANNVAAAAGIGRGDVILMVNNRKINSVSELNSYLGNTKQVALLIDRGGQQMFITINLLGE